VTPNNTGQHRLLGIDYSGSTVRDYYLDDNGNPAKQSNGALEPGVTHTATITDKIISWSYDWYGQGVRDFTLSRITGKLNSSLVLGNGQVAVQLEQCDI
jgi:hypothetical protein